MPLRQGCVPPPPTVVQFVALCRSLGCSKNIQLGCHSFDLLPLAHWQVLFEKCSKPCLFLTPRAHGVGAGGAEVSELGVREVARAGGWTEGWLRYRSRGSSVKFAMLIAC